MTIRLNGSTSGYTEIDAPAVAGSNTLVLPTGNGSSGQVLSTNGSGALSWVDRFSAAGPAFSAYASANQTISNGTNTKLQINTENFDTASCFDSTTNYRFTPTVAGYYSFNGSVSFVSGSATQLAICTIFKNGSAVAQGSSSPFFSTIQNFSHVSALVYLNGSTDYVELFTYQNSGSSWSTQAGASNIYFDGFLARPA
jgi:hypothetical protein